MKRDMEITRDEVRVMTVHGAKGLEARIVILADTTTPPAGPAQHQPRLLPMPAPWPGAGRAAAVCMGRAEGDGFFADHGRAGSRARRGRGGISAAAVRGE